MVVTTTSPASSSLQLVLVLVLKTHSLPRPGPFPSICAHIVIQSRYSKIVCVHIVHIHRNATISQPRAWGLQPSERSSILHLGFFVRRFGSYVLVEAPLYCLVLVGTDIPSYIYTYGLDTLFNEVPVSPCMSKWRPASKTWAWHCKCNTQRKLQRAEFTPV